MRKNLPIEMNIEAPNLSNTPYMISMADKNFAYIKHKEQQSMVELLLSQHQIMR
jgi:hypothetical protein